MITIRNELGIVSMSTILRIFNQNFNLSLAAKNYPIHKFRRSWKFYLENKFSMKLNFEKYGMNFLIEILGKKH